MIRPTTLEEAKKIRYGQWGGNPKGNKYSKNHCAYEVMPTVGFPIPYQCARKNGHGPGNLYCKQHSKIVEEYFSNNAD